MNDLFLVLSKINFYKYFKIIFWHWRRNWKYLLSKEYKIDFKKSSIYGIGYELRRCIRFVFLHRIYMIIKYGNEYIGDWADHIWIASVLGGCLKKKYEK